MTDPSAKRLRQATAVYWFILLYIIAALIWWFVSLEKQSRQMANYEIKELQWRTDSIATPLAYHQQLDGIQNRYKRREAKYMGEGLFFFGVMMIGAVFVYRAVRRQFREARQQENFMMAITHELKTPIAITMLNLETLRKYQLDEEKKQKIISAALQENTRLSALTNNILISSQLEGGRYPSAKEELDFSMLVENSVQDFARRFPDRKLIGEIEPELSLHGDTLLLQILVNNLLDNALKYSPRNGKIGCRLETGKESIILRVTDEGPGIADAEKKKIFHRFYRSGNEATRIARGTGLGLYLCKKIAAGHNADITVTNNSPAGSIFAVVFKI